MRIDAVTIFPEYLEPLRHALLGKAIEQGILEVGVHNLRDFATGNHKSVDAPPLGGGPGMVMKPEVWGPALDAVAEGRDVEALTTAAAHRNDKLRHDEVAEVAARPYAERDVRGEDVEMFTVPRKGFAEGPNGDAIVELDEGPRMMSNIIDCPQTPEALELDMPLEVAFEALDDKITLPLFRPAKG